MMLTKKRMVLVAIFMTALYFILLLFLPDSIVGTRAENMALFSMKIGFLAISAAIMTVGILIFIFRKEYIKGQWSTFRRYKYLLQQLVKRDFVARYRKSTLGVLWSLLNPLLTMLVMTFVFSYIFRRDIPNFPVYLLSGQIIFGFYSEATNIAMSSIISSEGIMKKVYVPKYIFPLSKVVSSLVNLFFSFLAFILVFIVTRAPFHWTILLFPVPIIYTFVFTFGVSMFLSSMAVFFRDLRYLYGVFLTLLLYFTPLFYPADIIPKQYLPFMGLNPLYHFIDYFRALALRGVIPGLWDNIVCLGFSVFALCAGTYVFMSRQDRYILYL